VADSIAHDPTLSALVDPFRVRMDARISEVIGQSAGNFYKGFPEGTLGNFAADALLEITRQRTGLEIDFALMNNGGLRVPIGPGPITVGLIFELMPFENMVSVLVLDGRQVHELVQHIVVMRGEPVAGITFRMNPETEEGTDIRVNGASLDPARRYRLVTSDYLAKGGDDYSVFLTALEREDLSLLIRDALMEYIRAHRVIEPRMEGRITVTEGGGGGR
jgi:2',3'-cyclic-nucleotide 2'-phosphodiesterase (5'-nucleotidase family)